MTINFSLGVIPSKEMEDRTRQKLKKKKKKNITTVGIEPTTSGFRRHLLYRPRREQELGGCGCN